MENGGHMAAVELQLAPGWKTYWRSPGDAGIPPSFDWSGSENVKSVRLHWPAPEVFEANGMQTIGYHERLVLPVEITPRTRRVRSGCRWSWRSGSATKSACPRPWN
jgi:DsbC/DsbD-like thiol-disulfide interchange protein